jgi:hypothetical protein
MKTDIEPKTGKWLLVMGSRAVVPTLLKMIGRLAETGASAALGAETADGSSKESSGFHKPEAVDGGLTPPRPGLGLWGRSRFREGGECHAGSVTYKLGYKLGQDDGDGTSLLQPPQKYEMKSSKTEKKDHKIVKLA